MNSSAPTEMGSGLDNGIPAMKKIFDTLSDLPVNTLLDDIICHAKTGGVVIVTAATASGKTLLVPTWMHMVTDRNITILEPRRFLAISAAETIAKLSDTALGETVSYAVSTRGSHERISRTRGFRGLLFTSYGYVLAAKSLSSATDIVFDEAHEPGTDIAVCKALIKQRMMSPATRPNSVIIMSATLDATAELEYWKDFDPKVFSIADEQRFVCTKRFEPGTPVYKAAGDLVEAGHKGVLVFVSGMKEIEDTTKDLRHLLALRGEDAIPVEIATIHGNTDFSDRMAAFAAPADGAAKILIGTNVLETGMNISWVDAGVSSGVHKENVVIRESGAVSLQEVPLSRANLDQQAGRTNRFCDSTFILCGRTSPNEMLSAPVSELKRLPLTQLYMHCVGYGVDPRALDFMPKLDHAKLDEAEVVLRRFGFLDVNDQLTKDGEFSQSHPVGLEAAAFLCHATKLDILQQALPLAAVLEHGPILYDQRVPHGFDTTSDVIDAAIAFTFVYTLPEDLYPKERKEEIARNNVNRKKYANALEILKSLENALRIRADLSAYRRDVERDPELIAKLRQCLLAAGITRLGVLDPGAYKRPVVMTNSALSYGKDIGSVVYGSYQPQLITASLKEIRPRSGLSRPFTVAWNITAYEADYILAFHKVRPDVFTFDVISSSAGHATVYAFGERIAILRGFTRLDSAKGVRYTSGKGSVGSIFGSPEDYIYGGRRQESEGISLGDLLEEALRKRTSLLQDKVLEAPPYQRDSGKYVPGALLETAIRDIQAIETQDNEVTARNETTEPVVPISPSKTTPPKSPVKGTVDRSELLKLAARFNTGR